MTKLEEVLTWLRKERILVVIVLLVLIACFYTYNKVLEYENNFIATCNEHWMNQINLICSVEDTGIWQGFNESLESFDDLFEEGQKR